MTDDPAGSLVLLLAVSAILDERNEVSLPGRPLYYSAAMLAVGVGLGTNCGVGVNPARDLSPRLVSSLLGWGAEVITASGLWALVSLLASHAGGATGVWLYRAVLRPRHSEARAQFTKETPRKEFKHCVQITQNEAGQERRASLVNLFTEEVEVEVTSQLLNIFYLSVTERVTAQLTIQVRTSPTQSPSFPVPLPQQDGEDHGEDGGRLLRHGHGVPRVQ